MARRRPPRPARAVPRRDDARRRPAGGVRGRGARGRRTSRPPWERFILSRSFRLVVGATFAVAAIAVLIFLVGPATISRALDVGGRLHRPPGRAVGGWRPARSRARSRTRAAASGSRRPRRWRARPRPPTPAADRDAVPDPAAAATADRARPDPAVDSRSQPGQPQTKPRRAAAAVRRRARLDAPSTSRSCSDGDVRRALQYWAPDAAPEARSALDAAIARGEKYTVRAINLRPMPQIGGVEVVADVEVTDTDRPDRDRPAALPVAVIDNQWFITARLQ